MSGFLNLDPIGTLARWGTLALPLDEALAEAMALAKEARTTEPRLRTVLVDATVYHEAGATTEMGMSYPSLVGLIRGAGKVPMERDSLYRAVKTDFSDLDVPQGGSVRRALPVVHAA